MVRWFSRGSDLHQFTEYLDEISLLLTNESFHLLNYVTCGIADSFTDITWT